MRVLFLVAAMSLISPAASANPGTIVEVDDDLTIGCQTPNRTRDLLHSMGNADGFNALFGSLERAGECRLIKKTSRVVVVEDEPPDIVLRVRLLPNGPDMWVDAISLYGGDKVTARLEAWLAANRKKK